VTDEFGTVYLWQGRYGNWAWNLDASSPHRQGWAIDGERLEGDWWVALEPQVPWKPRQITVTFRVPPANLHGTARVKKPYMETATLTLPLEHPTAALLPDYMTHVAVGLQERDVPIARAHARGFYYELGLPDRLDFVKPDLPRALEYHHEVIRLREQREKETGQPGFNPETWENIGRVLRKMGRLQETRAAFQKAIREAISPGHERRQAEEALEAVEGEIAWQPGRTAPSFRATDLEGKEQSPEQYRGQVLLIHLWHAWDDSPDDSAKGRADLPVVADLYRKHQEQGLAVLGIGIHFRMPKLLKVVEQHRLTWPQICDGQGWRGKLHRQLGTPAVPHTILIDRQGTIRAVGLHGPALRKAVAELVAAR
jgi:hypothetical protein